MPRNPILEEIYATREKLLAACKGDLHAYIEEAKRRTLASGRPIATVKRQQKGAKADAPATAGK